MIGPDGMDERIGVALGGRGRLRLHKFDARCSPELFLRPTELEFLLP